MAQQQFTMCVCVCVYSAAWTYYTSYTYTNILDRLVEFIDISATFRSILDPTTGRLGHQCVVVALLVTDDL